MPYLHCPECRLTVYSAARFSTLDTCPRCGASLEGAPRSLFPLRAELARETGRAKYAADLMRKAIGSTGAFRDPSQRAL